MTGNRRRGECPNCPNCPWPAVKTISGALHWGRLGSGSQPTWTLAESPTFQLVRGPLVPNSAQKRPGLQKWAWPRR